MSAKAEPDQHFYGGQAVLEGVMMRGPDRYAVAVRREDGEVLTLAEPLQGYAVRQGWHKWPLIRGNYMLIESFMLGFRALQFSADVLTAEETAKSQAASPETAAPPQPMHRLWMGLTWVLSLLLGVGLFVILPTMVPKWIWGAQAGAQGLNAHSVLFNVVEGGVRLAVIVLYIVTISLMKYVRRVFQYHGAEHATINCYEAGEPVTPENCARFSPLHPRCGTAFLLLVIVVKIILGCFLGWPVLWLRAILRVALLPVVAAVAYEILRWVGRHRDSWVAGALAGPGLLLQRLTTRPPTRDQLEVAIYALAAVAPEVALTLGLALPRRVDARLQPVGEGESRGPDGGAG